MQDHPRGDAGDGTSEVTLPRGTLQRGRDVLPRTFSDGMGWWQVTEQQGSALDDFPTVSRPGRACFHPQKHSSFPQPTQASHCSAMKECELSQL